MRGMEFSSLSQLGLDFEFASASIVSKHQKLNLNIGVPLENLLMASQLPTRALEVTLGSTRILRSRISFDTNSSITYFEFNNVSLFEYTSDFVSAGSSNTVRIAHLVPRNGSWINGPVLSSPGHSVAHHFYCSFPM